MTTVALAQPVGEVTFTRLLVRDDGDGVFAFSDEVVRQLALDELRDHGLPVPAGDSVLFVAGMADAAAWQVGGTLIDLACMARRCEATVDWQLFYSPSATVQYEVTTRGTAIGADPSGAAVEAVRASLGSMLARPALHHVLAEPFAEKVVDSPDPPGALAMTAGAPVEPERTWGRAPPPPGRAQIAAGTVVGSVGAALGFLAWNDYLLSRELTVGRFRRQQVVNTVGWGGVTAGASLAVLGIVRSSRASRPPEQAPEGVQ